MIYTLAGIRAVARSKDERLEDTDKYPDSWIDTQIEHGFEVAESSKQVFYTTEKYDLTADIDAGLSEVEIILQKEPHKIYGVKCDTYGLKVDITGNKHLIITIDPSAVSLTDKTVVVSYFFYPTLPFTEIEMSPEVYHFFRHCLYVNLYGSLRDKENELYHQQQVDKFVKEGSFETPYNFEEETAFIFGRQGWL